MDWQNVAHEFEPDRALRDIYVLDTGFSEWQRVLDSLRASVPGLAYAVDHIPTPLPDRVEDAFAEYERERSPKLQFEVGGVTLICHFFTPEEMEFDLRPDEITGMDQLQAILDFMKMLGKLTNKVVLLTPESWKQSPIFRFEPSSEHVVYVPPPV